MTPDKDEFAKADTTLSSLTAASSPKTSPKTISHAATKKDRLSLSPPSHSEATPPAATMSPTHSIEAELEPDIVADETDSAFGDESESFTESLRSSVIEYTYENGRRYHAFGRDRYFCPNDEQESDRLDLCAHMLSLLLNGELHLAPIGPDPHRILDLATGTGIWAIDIADQYPSAEVLGNDLSAVQPSFVPLNVRFEIDDIEEPWDYSMQFDYIHCRYLGGAIKDWPRLIKQAYKYTRPGGWVEFMDFTMTFYTANGEFRPGCAVDRWTNELKASLHSYGLEPEPGPKLEGWIWEAGFRKIHHKRLGLPVGMWPKDKRMKEIGTINLMQFLDNLEGFSLRPMTARGWEKEEISVFLAEVRKDFKNPRFRMQHDGHVVYAQKPLSR